MAVIAVLVLALALAFALGLSFAFASAFAASLAGNPPLGNGNLGGLIAGRRRWWVLGNE